VARLSANSTASSQYNKSRFIRITQDGLSTAERPVNMTAANAVATGAIDNATGPQA